MKIGIIGFGEVGTILAQDFTHQQHQVTIWDRKLWDDKEHYVLRQKAYDMSVNVANSIDELVQNQDLIFSVVTADQAENVAQSVGQKIEAHQFFLDLNSVAPNTKIESSYSFRYPERYIDVAVMAPFPPKRLQTPLLISAKQAQQVVHILSDLNMNAENCSTQIGHGSAIKMCRSIFIKGLEAITTESLNAAKSYAVEQAVLDSLQRSFPSLGWDNDFGNYLISRVAEHGMRRSEEMLEVVKTLEDKNLNCTMSRATSHFQRAFVDQMKQKSIIYQEPFDWQKLHEQLYDA